MTLDVGDQFPQDDVFTSDGSINLAQIWAHGPMVIAFHRLWCPFCQQAAIQLTEAAPEIERLGGKTIIAYREDVHTVARSCNDRRTRALCVSDVDRSLERAVDLNRFKLRRYALFSPRRLLQAQRAGASIGSMGTNVLQGRGTFVVDTAGKIVYAHQARTAADIPAIHDILAAAKAAAEPT